MDISSWYNNAKYSDLSVRLRDGREIKVDKIVACDANDWFKKACGPGSHFIVRPSTSYVLARFRLPETSQESTQDVIKLEEEDPNAMDTVLRHIYKLPIGPPDKYLVPALSGQACKYFHDCARSEQDMDEVTDIIENLHKEMSHDIKFVELAAELRGKHLRELLQHKRYREKVQNDQALRWEHVDELLHAGQPLHVGQPVHAGQPLRANGEIVVNIPPGATKQCFIANSGRSGDRVKLRCESAFGAEGRVRLFQPIPQYP